MKENSWEFLIRDKKDAFGLENWHHIELSLLRRQEFHRLVRELGHSEACEILKKRKDEIEERNRIWKLENPPWVLEKKSLAIAEEARRGKFNEEQKVIKIKEVKENIKIIREKRNAGTKSYRNSGRCGKTSVYVSGA